MRIDRSQYEMFHTCRRKWHYRVREELVLPFDKVLPSAADRGTALHKAFELHQKGEKMPSAEEFAEALLTKYPAASGSEKEVVSLMQRLIAEYKRGVERIPLLPMLGEDVLFEQVYTLPMIIAGEEHLLTARLDATAPVAHTIWDLKTVGRASVYYPYRNQAFWYSLLLAMQGMNITENLDVLDLHLPDYTFVNLILNVSDKPSAPTAYETATIRGDLLKEYIEELLAGVIDMINGSRYPNRSACVQYGRLCDYAPLCQEVLESPEYEFNKTRYIVSPYTRYEEGEE